jgi:hypothetical protein
MLIAAKKFLNQVSFGVVPEHKKRVGNIGGKQYF